MSNESSAELSFLLHELLRRVDALERTGTLAHASLEGGTLPVYDRLGDLRQEIGKQPDGTYTTVDSNGPPPPVPAAGTVTGAAGLLIITSYGTALDGATWPRDFAKIDVHASTLGAGFTPTAATKIGSFGDEGGVLTAALDPGGWTVKFVAVNTSGAASIASATMTATVTAAVVSGGVKTYSTDSAPTGLDASDDGALWFDTDNGNAQSRWNGQALAWVSVMVGAGAIGDEAIEGRHVGKGQVDPGSLIVSPFSPNLIQDPSFADPELRVQRIAENAAGWSFVEDPDDPDAFVLQVEPGNEHAFFLTPKFPVNAGTIYHVEAIYQTDTGSVDQGFETALMNIEFYDADGDFVSSGLIASIGVYPLMAVAPEWTAAQSYTRYPPARAVTGRVYVMPGGDAGNTVPTRIRSPRAVAAGNIDASQGWSSEVAGHALRWGLSDRNLFEVLPIYDDERMSTEYRGDWTHKGAFQITADDLSPGRPGRLIVPQSGISYAGDSGLVSPIFAGSWANYSTTYQGAEYYRENGWVTVRGLVSGGTANSVIFTLAAGFRPAKWELFANVVNSSIARIDVRSDGTVRTTGGTTGVVSLSGIRFAAADWAP